ncbi:12734_t:CDS:2 [Funneliformis geosporum]|uniref:12734_t:CDS:1 n=1 Tax=Funneliformis geosporum TaxID=1117311 RepID=A0A9W4T4X8_9GLOM|nr:12734_t:CDS:2 [Funneliformis geosporum]
MVDESTCEEIKNFILCYQTVSNSVAQSIQKDGLDTTKCILWVTDNTAYMASNKKETIEILSNDEFRELFNSLENGINKAYEYFEKWLDPWLHLLLVICHLDGIHLPIVFVLQF